MRKIDDSAFIAEGAKVIRDVVLEKNSSVFHGLMYFTCLSCLWSVLIQTGNRYKSGSGCGATFSRNADDRSRGADRSGGRNRDS